MLSDRGTVVVSSAVEFRHVCVRGQGKLLPIKAPRSSASPSIGRQSFTHHILSLLVRKWWSAQYHVGAVFCLPYVLRGVSALDEST